MYLDETILQSRTTLTLVEYIDELYKYLDRYNMSNSTWTELERKYHDIKGQSEKALAKRSKRL